MAALKRYFADLQASLDGTAFFMAASFCAFSLWLALAIEISEPVQSIALAVLLLPLLMLPGAVPVAIFAASWALVRHRTKPLTFAAGWLVVCGASLSVMQYSAYTGPSGSVHAAKELAFAAAVWSIQLAACALIYAKLARS
jgi:hypothetical protein